MRLSARERASPSVSPPGPSSTGPVGGLSYSPTSEAPPLSSRRLVPVEGPGVRGPGGLDLDGEAKVRQAWPSAPASGAGPG